MERKIGLHFIAVADTDIGITKETNQDSLLIKHGRYENEELLLSIVCDGMGGLDKGEVASATVIKEFSRWFDEDFPYELNNLDLQIIGAKWELLIKELNNRLLKYGTSLRVSMGTTFTGILFVGNKYLVMHVGDTRLYKLDSTIKQLTEDQTFIARELKAGTITVEEAKIDKRRNMLLQCIGASEHVKPVVFSGETTKGVYMICSDGFRHMISDEEIYESLNPANLVNKKSMHANINYLINQVKKRQEKDNISVILVKVE